LRPARTRAVVARNHDRDGYQQGVGPASALGLAQKPQLAQRRMNVVSPL
jgi:hypothetical protein